MPRTIFHRLVHLPVWAALVLAAAPALASTTFCVGTVGELRSAIADAAQIDDVVYIKVKSGTYSIDRAIRYDPLFAQEIRILGGYDGLCWRRTWDPAATVISFPTPALAPVLNIDFELRTRKRIVLESLTFSGLDDVHLLLEGNLASALVQANRFLNTGGLSIDSNDFGADGTFSLESLMSSFHPAFGTRVEVYDNVILNTPYEDGLWIRTGQFGTVWVKYNTLYHSEGYNLLVLNDKRPNTVRISSNIFFGDSVSDVLLDGDAGWSFVRNIYRTAIECPHDTFDTCYWEDPRLNYQNVDPRLDANGRPQSSVAVVDRGEDTVTPSGLAYDVVGGPRLRGGRTDVGAYEIQ